MARFYLSTILSLASILLLSTAPSTSNAILVASNQFETSDAHLTAQDHRRIAAGHQADSPFGSGCVGTSDLCGLAHSRADETERDTLHRDHHPTIYVSQADIDWQRALDEATPSKRLQMYYERLGGKDYDKKRELSQDELQMLLEETERDGEHARADKLHANQQAREQMAELRRFRNRFRQLSGHHHSASSHHAKATKASSFSSSAGHAKHGIKASSKPSGHGHGHGHSHAHGHGKSSHSPGHRHHASALSGKHGARMMRRRALLHDDVEPRDDDGADYDDDVEEQEVSEDDAFHQHLRQRFSRPWSAA
ncbi:hypothetical protein BDZ90DRAFT_227229 [Jaminaea rosea]|uniref:Uncharacterized protein n=1 Tax=Jaminaea rosea TaxID=1569628 RepID=A0A316UR71_9BASI|nr:hypothetical protein BDZ90DRAFT_227229 [Jaminaea rosea]PWN27474.1 hypothetical protein BDZ90DRAFT_227229 [Jaminaea rosea]